MILCFSGSVALGKYYTPKDLGTHAVGLKRRAKRSPVYLKDIFGNGVQ